MGFDSNCVINVESLKGECLCPVCGNLVYPNEAMQTPCGHLYCKPCLAYVEQNTKICPQDGMFVTASEAKHLVKVDGALAIAIWHTSVRCIHHMSGCLWQGTLFDSMSHTYDCAHSYSQAMDAQQYQLQPEQYMQYYQSYPLMQQQQQQQQLPWSDPNAQQQYMGMQQSIPLQAQQFPYQAMQPQFIPPQYTTFMGSPQLPNSLNNPSGPVLHTIPVSGNVTGLPQRQQLPLQLAPQRLNLGNKKEVSLQVPNLHQTPHDERRMKKKERENLVTSYAINCGNRHGSSSSQFKRPSSSIKIEPFSPPPPPSSSQLKGATTAKIEPIYVDDSSSPSREQRPIKADSFLPLSPVSSEQFNWTWSDDDDFIPFPDFGQSTNVDAGQAQNIAGDFEGFLGDDISLPANTKMIHGVDNFGGKTSIPNSIQLQYQQVDMPSYASGGSSPQLVHGTGIHPSLNLASAFKGDMEASNPNSNKRQRKGIICAICSVVVEDLEAHSRTTQHNDALNAFIMSNKPNSWKKQRLGGDRF